MGSELAINSGTQNNYLHQAENDNTNIVIRGCRKIKKAIQAVLNCFINAVNFVIELIIPQKTTEDRDIASESQAHPKLTTTIIENTAPNLAELKIEAENTIAEEQEIFSKLDIFLNEETDKIPPLKIVAEDFQYTTERKNEKVLIGSGFSYDAYLATHKDNNNQTRQLVVLTNRSLTSLMKYEPPSKSRDEGLEYCNITKIENRFKQEHQVEKNTFLITKKNELSLIVMPYKGCELNSFRSTESEEIESSGRSKQRTIKKLNAEIKDNISNLLATESQQKILTDNDGAINEDLAHHILRQLLEEKYKLSEKNLSNDDIKPSNICIDKDTKVSMIDCGGNNEFENKNSSKNIYAEYTEEYAAPEIILNHHTYMNSAVWNIGATMYELLLPSQQKRDCLNDIRNENYTYDPISDAKYASCVDKLKCSTKLKNIIAKLLIVDHSKRPTAKQALELLGPRPEIEQMNLLDLTLTKSKLENVVANLQSLATDADRRKQEQTIIVEVIDRLDFAKQQLNQVCKQIDHRKICSTSIS